MTLSLFLSTALFSFFVIPFFFVLISYTLFWYATVNSPHQAYLNELSKGRIHRLLVRGMLSSYASIILVVLLFPLGFMQRFRYSEPDGKCSFPPVILVHGLWHNPSAWLLFRLRLKQAGFANIYALDYDSWTQGFHDVLKDLDRLVSEVSDRFPGKPVVLIGHSLGGLLCRAFADRNGSEEKVKAVITLGAPHQGTKLAALAMGKLARSLEYRGALFKELENVTPSESIHRLAIYSPIDTVILPFSALKVDHAAWKHYETSPVSHIGMVFHPATVKYVIDQLKEI